MKTIRMPKGLADAWLAALRSGEFKQGRKRLEDIEGGCTVNCCLGVLQKCAMGDVERRSHDNSSLRLPTYAWLSSQRIRFFNKDGDIDTNPWLPMLKDQAAAANDRKIDFLQIADAIEATLEVTE